MIAWVVDATAALREARTIVESERAGLIRSYAATPSEAKMKGSGYPLDAYDVETIDDRHAYNSIMRYGALVARIDAIVARGFGEAADPKNGITADYPENGMEQSNSPNQAVAPGRNGGSEQ